MKCGDRILRLAALSAACSLFAIILAGCEGEPETVSSSRTKYEVSEDAGKSPAPAAAANEPPRPEASTPVDDLSKLAKSATSAGHSPDANPVPTPPTAGAEKPAPSPPAASQNPDRKDTGDMPAAAVAENTPSAPVSPSPSVPGPLSAGQSYTITSDKPEEILASLKNLAGQRPSGATQAAAMADFQNLQNAVIAGGEKLLNMNVDGKTKQLAAEYILRGLETLSQLGDSDAPQRMKVFGNELAKSDVPELKRLGSLLDFQSTLETYVKSPSGDAQKVLLEFQKLFAGANKNPGSITVANQVASVLEQRGARKEAIEVLKTVVAGLDGADPALAEKVSAIKERIRITELDLQGKLAAMEAGKPEALKQLLEAINAVLDGQPAGEMSLSIAQSVAKFVESSDPKAAGQIYAKMTEVYGKNANPELGKQAKESSDLFQRRLTLVGQPFAIGGTTSDGTLLDAAKYKGKVVLVDFWATWCMPCLQDIPVLKKLLDKYREQGFEIVGINLDDNAQELKQFFQLQPLPWPTLIGMDPGSSGAHHPLAVKCGVESLPFRLLVDRSGNAVSINPAGDAMDKKIEELLKAPAAGK
jgi:thiol-disulfide isomerase/thioredoxin